MFSVKQVASLSCYDLFSCKVFQEFIVIVRLVYFFVIVMEIVVLYFSHNYVCGFVMDCQKGVIVRVIIYVIG